MMSVWLQLIGAMVIGLCAALQVSYFLTLKQKGLLWIEATACAALFFGRFFVPDDAWKTPYAVGAVLIGTAICYVSYTEAHWHKLYSALIQAFVSIAVVYLSEITAISMQLPQPQGDIVTLLLMSLLHILWCVIMYVARRKVFTILPEPEENYRKTFLASLLALIALMVLSSRLDREAFAAIEPKFLFIGMLLTIVALSVLCILHLCVMSNEQMAAEERMLTMQTQNQLMKQYVDNVMDQYNTIHILQHDQKHQLSTLYTFLTEGKTEEAEKHLSLLLNRKTARYQADYCIDVTINAVMLDACIRCEHERIRFEPQIKVSDAVEINPVDLVALLKNAIDNAIYCCVHLQDPTRGYLHIAIQTMGGYLSIKCGNPVDKAPEIRKNRILSTRTEDGQRHGLGMESMHLVVKKYDGMLKLDTDGKTFTLSAVLENRTG